MRTPAALLFLAPLAFGVAAYGQNPAHRILPKLKCRPRNPKPRNPIRQPHPRDKAPAVISVTAAVT
jgi:hypothetical protein